MQKSKTAITPKAKSKGKDQTSENFSEDKEGTESAEREIFFDEVKRLTLLRLELHRCLMNILQYLSAYEDVGIDADNKCSGEMALYQMSIMEQEAQEAAGYIVQLPQTEFMLELHTAVQMIRQKLDITRRCAPDTIANAEDDESVIRYVRETGMRSSEKVGPVLNRLAAELMTRELSSEMQQATEYIYKQIALKEMNVGIEHEKDFKITDSKEEITLLNFMRKYCDLTKGLDLHSKVSLLYKVAELPKDARSAKRGQRRYFYADDLAYLWPKFCKVIPTLPSLIVKKSNS